MKKNIQAELRDFLFHEFGLENLASDEPLFSSRKLRSIDAMRLVFFLKKRFGLQKLTAGLKLSDLDTLASLESLILAEDSSCGV